MKEKIAIAHMFVFALCFSLLLCMVLDGCSTLTKAIGALPPGASVEVCGGAYGAQGCIKITNGDGKVTQLPSIPGGSVTFADGNIVVTNGDGTVTKIPYVPPAPAPTPAPAPPK